MWEGEPLPTPGISRVQIERSGAYFGQIFDVLSIPNFGRKYSFTACFFTQVDALTPTRRSRSPENMWRGRAWEGVSPSNTREFLHFG